MSKAKIALVSAVLLGVMVSTTVWAAEERTARRTVPGVTLKKNPLQLRAAHEEHVPLISNYEEQKKESLLQPNTYTGEDWNPSLWPKPWTPSYTIKKFFEAKIFKRQYMRNGKIPVVELGPTFHKLSELDQRRSLKLLTDNADIFKQGYRYVELNDWYTHEVLGSFTPAGLFMKKK